VLRRLTDIEKRLTDVQALAARGYEATLAWPARLAEIREAGDYEAAFEGEPLVSVRVATYHAPDILCERALASLRRQTYSNWEALVVGDHCTDDTEERVRGLGDSRIRFWNLPFRGPYPDDPRDRWFVAGAYPANAGIRASRGAWIAPLDHDDEWDDDHIEVLLAEAQRTRAELVYGRMRVINEETGARSELGAWPPDAGQFAFQGAIHHRGLGAFEYDVNCRFAGEPGDWNLARRMWAAGVRFGFLDRIVGTYHHQPRHRQRSTLERLYEETREWARNRDEGLQFWHARAEALEQRLRALEADGDQPLA
jgi:glycosyltransferase involved in cell wall biosynthesis